MDEGSGLEGEKWQAEFALKAKEVELAERRVLLEEKQNRKLWRQPLLVPLFGAVAAGFFSIWISNDNAEALRSRLEQNNRATLDIEQIRAASEAARLRTRSESELILSVLDTGNPDSAAENLKFILDIGLINDPDLSAKLQRYLEQRAPGEGPALGAANSMVPNCNLIASKSVASDGEPFLVSWRGTPSNASWWINGLEVEANDEASYFFDAQFDYMSFTLYGENEFGTCGSAVEVIVEPTCLLSAVPSVIEPGEEYRIEWKAGPVDGVTFINGEEVANEGHADFSFIGPTYDRFRLVSNLRGGTCQADVFVLGDRADEPIDPEECGIRAEPQFVDAGSEYSIRWAAPEGGTYWFENDEDRSFVGREGSYSFIWEDEDATKTFDFVSEVAGETCRDTVTVYKSVDPPRCHISTNRTWVQDGETYVISWEVKPDVATAFRINGELVDHKGASLNTLSIDQPEEIEFVLEAHNAAGNCREIVTVHRDP